MSRYFLLSPATWPALALNPEPRGQAADGDSIERLYLEWFGTDPQTQGQTANPVKPSPSLVPLNSRRYRPSLCLHQTQRRH